ncbi:MAG: hypothetical protein ABSD56_12910 [Bryobacteraceae bacterium]
MACNKISVRCLYFENGKGCAGLAVVKDGPGLVLRDENGKGRALLGTSKDGPRLTLADEDGKAIWSQP